MDKQSVSNMGYWEWTKDW
ncbi:hypothetical protein G210_0882 [Candida maltosa Xu316]|uniref:Uncharacterized protein n=1 Tax=Candida maltosa (strain Xu316) TaxID=1245528 RepID=M3J8X2_CANMX|nr:hypothetical protein G210_0882 [Candida maltosa Xu316]